MTLSIPRVTPFTLGMLIALFERAVSFYASLVHINAYHQPGVEAGKKAATRFLTKLAQVRDALGDAPLGAEDIAGPLGADPEDVHHALVHLAANGRALMETGPQPATDRFRRP